MTRFAYRLGVGVAVIIGMAMLTGCAEEELYETRYTSAARHKATMRTYRVRGRTYRPTYVRVGDTMRGISSWYGPKFHGQYTSNGEIYNMHKLTAAHKTWPMDTIVKVENLTNGRSVIVRINDRGPFVKGRIIDCSYAAGKRLGLDRTGLARVKLTVLGFAGKIYRPDRADRTHSAPPPRVHLSDFGVQVGAFRQSKGVARTRKRYQKILNGPLRIVVRKYTVAGAPLYRVWVMGFGSADEARDFIRDHHIEGGFLIRN